MVDSSFVVDNLYLLHDVVKKSSCLILHSLYMATRAIYTSPCRRCKIHLLSSIIQAEGNMGGRQFYLLKSQEYMATVYLYIPVSSSRCQIGLLYIIPSLPAALMGCRRRQVLARAHPTDYDQIAGQH